jgi:NAD(P)-dependent dehydrogenase (short-subunit alcohol dehydrogenase family)
MVNRDSDNSLATPLAGRTIVVTGASSGLGEQISAALARAGALVVVSARRADRLRELADRIGAEPVACDVTDADDRQRLIDTAVELGGGLDGLVNNAGWSKPGPASRETADDLRRHLEINLVAPFALCQLAAARMREREGGGRSIVNVASIAAYMSLAPMPEASYAASKAGLVALTRELASQWGRHGIRVNALAPGFFPSEMTDGLIAADGAAPDWLADSTPLGRVGRPGELDGATVFLLSEAASYVSGHVLAVDGGLLTR